MGFALVLLGLSSLMKASTAFVTTHFSHHGHQQNARFQASGCRNVALKANIVDIGSQAPRDIGSFQEWAFGNGVQTSDGFQLTSEDGLDISVMTTTDIPQGSPVLMVPQHMIFSANKWEDLLSDTESIRQAEQALQRCNMMQYYSEFALYVYLLSEVEKGDESPWYAWFNSLPRIYYNGASMTETHSWLPIHLTHCKSPLAICYECLPPYIASLARESRAKMTYFHQALQLVDDSIVTEETKINKELANWVFQVVSTRSFPSPDGDVKISPMADMVRGIFVSLWIAENKVR
eukprot:scaffold1923_cov160-Amphora_coffeaeformis.AAC.6